MKNAPWMFAPQFLARSLSLACCLGLAACGIFDSSPEEEATAKPEEASSESSNSSSTAAKPKGEPKAAKKEATGPQFVEVLWQINPERVDKYHIYFGADAANLDGHVEIPIKKIQKVEHPTYGPVYRYELQIPRATRDTYVSIQAENVTGVSPASPPTRIVSRSN